MAQAATELGAQGEAVVFLNHFRDLPDARQAGKVPYPLEEILLLCLLGVGSRDVRRHCPVRPEETRSSAPVPAISRWYSLAR